MTDYAPLNWNKDAHSATGGVEYTATDELGDYRVRKNYLSKGWVAQHPTRGVMGSFATKEMAFGWVEMRRKQDAGA